MIQPFPGFPPEGLKFFAQLKKNNNRDWFQPRKETFDTAIKAPMEALVQAINANLVSFAPQFITEPKKSIYRIYRDTRFSNDKTPYKTHIAAGFNRAGMDRHVSAGFYFSVGADRIEIAGGIYMPGADELRALRTFLLDHHDDFRTLSTDKTVVKLVGPLQGESLTRPPKGFPCDHAAADLLKRKQFFFYDTRLDPAIATTPKLFKEILKRFEAMTPFIESMNQPLRAMQRKEVLTVDRAFER
ncbi:MAG: DUF2461 domain-containing protein [Acidobacteria bacterium]|nr:DUF2461 domain-containing protein [Acidobacteriota bacterium]